MTLPYAQLTKLCDTLHNEVEDVSFENDLKNQTIALLREQAVKSQTKIDLLENQIKNFYGRVH